MKQGVVKKSALLLLVTVSFLVVGTNSQQCPQPSQSEISTSLRTYLISTGGESSTIIVNLQNYNFTCQAVAARDMYRSLSVAVQYTTTNSGVTSAVQYDQFQLECVTGSPNHFQLPSSAPFEDDVSPSLLTTPTRRDCQFCTGLSSGPAGLDTTANCFACSSTCLGVGQGACVDGTTCCPFFNTDGSCTTACPTNYTASSDTNYICSDCAIPCPSGHEPNTACDGCVPVHICVTNDPCQNGATCNIGTDSNTDYTCSCLLNYSGQTCDQCVLPCPLGYEPNSACTGCVPVHICVTNNPCQNGATCNIGTNSNTDYTCSCPPNYTGQDCEQCVLPCPLGYAPNSACTECVPVHICVTSNPCQNGATCNIGTNNNTDYTCSCVQNFSGKNCTECVLPCPLGYEPNSNCTECVPVHICVTSNPCQNGATCNIGSNSNTNYTCSCTQNILGNNCTECVLPCTLGSEPNSACTGCVPVHICVTSNPCQNGATCNIGSNSNTNYTCSCPQNVWSGINCTECVFPCPLGHQPNSACSGCDPAHICLTSNPCQNGATCNINSNDITDYTCSCIQHFSQKNCTECVLPCPLGRQANPTCTMCDPAHVCLTSNPCQNGATCVINSASNTDYTCTCPPNYTGQNCDECIFPCPLGYKPNSACNGCDQAHICLTSNPCQNGGTCNIGTDSDTDYTCSCSLRYTGQNCEIQRCVFPCPPGYLPNSACDGCDPVHICVTNNPCQNGATCVIGDNSNNDYTCSCTSPYTGRTCSSTGSGLRWWDVLPIVIGVFLGVVLLVLVIFMIANLIYRARAKLS